MAKAINDGLNFYEEGLWLNDDEEGEGWINCTGSSASENERTNVNIISQEDFAKIRQSKKEVPTYYQRPPAPPPVIPNTKLSPDTQTYNNAVIKTKSLEDDLELDMQFQVFLYCYQGFLAQKLLSIDSAEKQIFNSYTTISA